MIRETIYLACFGLWDAHPYVIHIWIYSYREIIQFTTDHLGMPHLFFRRDDIFLSCHFVLSLQVINLCDKVPVLKALTSSPAAQVPLYIFLKAFNMFFWCYAILSFNYLRVSKVHYVSRLYSEICVPVFILVFIRLKLGFLYFSVTKFKVFEVSSYRLKMEIKYACGLV